MPVVNDSKYHQQEEVAEDYTGARIRDMAEFWKNCRLQRSSSSKRRLMEVENGSVMVATSGDIPPPSLFDLQPELLGLIAENLCVVDYFHFRCVNRVCASSTFPPRVNSFPISLIHKDRSKGVYNILADGNLNNKLSIKIPDGLEDYVIRCSKDGWLLLENKEDLAFLNPLARKVIRAGRHSWAREHRGSMNYTFLRKPSSSSSDCSILAMSHYPRWNAGGTYSVKRSPESAEWRTFGLRRTFIQGSSSPTVLEDSFYYLGDDGKLGRGLLIDEDGQCTCHWEVFDDLTFPRLKFRLNYLIECGGELMSVLVGDEGTRPCPWVRVFKLRNHEEWEEIQTLGGYCLYVNRLSSISCLAQRPDEANRIYFPKFCKDELVYYSLSTKRYHTAGSQHKLQSFNQTSMFADCAWFTPSWS